jgi:hypothetical protein
MKLIRSTFLASLFIALAAPLLQRELDLFQESELRGIEESTKLPELSLRSFWDGEFQKNYQSWFNENIGFRGALIRTENQLNFSLFRDISSRSPSKISLGKEDYLFERSYLQAYKEADSIRDEDLRNLAVRLKRLQDRLSARGIAFLLLISPSKPELYSDKLPRHIALRGEELKTDYKTFLQELTANGVRTLDAPRLLSAERAATGYPVFPKSGTHWSYYASCLITNLILKEIEEQLQKKLIKIDCSSLEWDDRPRLHDKDLAELINVWDPSPTFEKMPYPRSRSVRDGSEERPKAIIIGSSFVWPLLYYFDRHKIFSRRDFYYYFKTNHTWPPKAPVPIDPQTIDWEGKVFSRKAIVIEINQAVVNQAGFGFIDQALDRLNDTTSLN